MEKTVEFHNIMFTNNIIYIYIYSNQFKYIIIFYFIAFLYSYYQNIRINSIGRTYHYCK